MTVIRFLVASACVGVLGGHVSESVAGCSIQLSIRNTGTKTISVQHSGVTTTESAVKSRGGAWRGLYSGGWYRHDGDNWVTVPAGRKVTDTFEAAFACTAKRRWRIHYSCDDNRYVDYYPSPTTWTTEQTLTIRIGRCK
ncbi:MAG: hypothetical protein R3E48_22495 [Burkholderiaceae bacterium]